MKFYLLKIIIVLLFMLNSCEEGGNDCCFPGNEDIFDFSLTNSQGDDLLDPSIEGSYNTTKISILEYSDGEYVQIIRPNFDASRGYLIYHDPISGVHRIRTFIQKGEIKGDNIERKAIIRWNELDQDTLNLTLVQQRGIQKLIEIWYNGESVWDEETATNPNGRYFEIMK